MNEELFNEDKEALEQKVARLVQEQHADLLFEKREFEKMNLIVLRNNENSSMKSCS